MSVLFEQGDDPGVAGRLILAIEDEPGWLRREVSSTAGIEYRRIVTHLVDRRCAAPGADLLFARPATDAGRRLLDRAGFHSVGGSSEVWASALGAWPVPDRVGPDVLVSRRYVADLFGGARSCP